MVKSVRDNGEAPAALKKFCRLGGMDAEGTFMNKIITISREYGAGGHSIGQQVAKQLGIPFYDRDIIKETAKASGFDPELVEGEGEDVSSASSFWNTLCAVSSSYFSNTQDAIHDVQKAIILHFAQQGPCRAHQ